MINLIRSLAYLVIHWYSVQLSDSLSLICDCSSHGGSEFQAEGGTDHLFPSFSITLWVSVKSTVQGSTLYS